MFIELVDALRCVAPHEDSWLVAATQRMSGRSIVEGTLGCPVCQRSYPITGGVAYLGAEPGDTRAAVEAGDPPTSCPGENDVVRLAALLGLTTPGGLVVLAGVWATYADALLALTPVRLALLLDPPPRAGSGGPAWSAADDGRVSAIRAAAGALPLAAGVARAVALDLRSAGGARGAAAVRALAAGGRLVGPASAPVPDGVRELARDDTLWVAARVGGLAVGAESSAPVSLRRGPRLER